MSILFAASPRTAVLNTLVLLACLTLPAAFSKEEISPIQTTVPIPLTLKQRDDGSLELGRSGLPILTGCRAYLASRSPGSESWTEETVSYLQRAQSGNTLQLEAKFKHVTATITASHEPSGRWKLSGMLIPTSGQPLELARFHYLDGTLAAPSFHLLSMRQFELPGRIIRADEPLPPPREACERGWGKSVHWTRLADPVHDQANVGISGDTAMLAPDWNQPGCFFGFTGPGSAFGEIGLRTRRNPPSCFAAVLLDSIRIDAGHPRRLEDLVISFGDLQDELCYWATTTKQQLAPGHTPRPPMAGYCSWYQVGQNVQPADLRRALESFSPFAAPPGGRLIQLDDGFQVMPGDWSGRDAWRAELSKFPAEIRARGFIPGIWVAPTAIHERHPIVRDHPDWLQRDASGNFCIAFPNWGGKTYFLEPDHPEAREFIHECLRNLRNQGWDYFKIDFAYTVSSNRKPYDPYKTNYESLRDQWKGFRDAIGPDAILNSCNGGIWRYTLGTVDLSRMGGDIGGKMSLLRRNLAEMLLRSHVNQRWFVCDPDVFYLRKEHSNLSFEQSKLLTDTQGMLGMAFLTSDFGGQWDAPAQEVARRYWNPAGPGLPTAKRIQLNSDGLPQSILLAYPDGTYAALLYNWNQHQADTTINLAGLLPETHQTLHATPAFNDPEQVSLTEKRLKVHQQPAESVRVVRLSPK